AAGTLWAFALALTRPGRRALGAWAVLSALALATHYFALFLVGAEAVVLVGAIRHGRSSRATGVAVGAVGLVALALVPLIAEQLGRQGGSVDQTTLLRGVPTALVQFAVGQRLAIPGLYT